MPFIYRVETWKASEVKHLLVPMRNVLKNEKTDGKRLILQTSAHYRLLLTDIHVPHFPASNLHFLCHRHCSGLPWPETNPCPDPSLPVSHSPANS